MMIVSSFFALAFLAICLAFILLVLQLQAITIYKLLCDKYDVHDVVFVTWVYVNGFGVTKFKRIVYCRNRKWAYERIVHQRGDTDFKCKDYWQMTPSFVEMLLMNENKRNIKKNQRVGGGSPIFRTTTAVLGDWGDKPLPFEAITVLVSSDIDPDQLRKMGLI